jgi:hypothetical protein
MISHDWRVFDVGGARSLVRLRKTPFIIADELDCLRFFSARYARRVHEVHLNGNNAIFLAAWVPYFDNNLDAIIFLAPISGFDEVRLISAAF